MRTALAELGSLTALFLPSARTRLELMPACRTIVRRELTLCVSAPLPFTPVYIRTSLHGLAVRVLLTRKLIPLRPDAGTAHEATALACSLEACSRNL